LDLTHWSWSKQDIRMDGRRVILFCFTNEEDAALFELTWC
jgi:hypothetical protein